MKMFTLALYAGCARQVMILFLFLISDLRDAMIRQFWTTQKKHGLILLSGDKDFGCLIEFGTLWGRGKVILLRYRLINIDRVVKDIIKLLAQEKESFEDATSLIIVLSESGYRIHRQPARKR